MTKKVNESFFQSLNASISGLSSPVFARSVNPISTGGQGGRLCPPNDTGTPGFSDLPTALNTITQVYLNSNSTLCSVILTNNVSMCSLLGRYGILILSCFLFVLFEKICSIKSCHFSKSRNPDGIGKPDILHQLLNLEILMRSCLFTICQDYSEQTGSHQDFEI